MLSNALSLGTSVSLSVWNFFVNFCQLELRNRYGIAFTDHRLNIAPFLNPNPSIWEKWLFKFFPNLVQISLNGGKKHCHKGNKQAEILILAYLKNMNIQNFSTAVTLAPQEGEGLQCHLNPSTCVDHEIYSLVFNIHVRYEENSRFNSLFLFRTLLKLSEFPKISNYKNISLSRNLKKQE